ncbi:hypothetical protein ScPMuIL_017709 [Solemya velum]
MEATTWMDCWQEMPDSILLYIFSFLEHSDLGQVVLTCKTWCRVTYDEHLWRDLVKKRWKLKGDLTSSEDSWRAEYKRLHYHLPVICSQELEAHTDEVLDVSFSHSGDMFCTTSRDMTVKVWKLEGPEATLLFSDDVGLRLFWILTQYSCFNGDDSLLLVCGVKLPRFFTEDQDYDEPIGHGAIYSLEKNFQLVLVVPMDPPTLFGTWLDNVSCLGGYLNEANNTVTVKKYKVPTDNLEIEDLYIDDFNNIPVCDVSAGETLFTFRGDPHHFMSLLLATMSFEPCPPSDSDIVSISSDKLKRTAEACSPNRGVAGTLCGEKMECRSSSFSTVPREKRLKTSLANSDSQSSQTLKSLYERNDLENTVICEQSATESVTKRKYVIFVTGQHTVIAIHEIRSDIRCDDKHEAASEVNNQLRVDVPDYILNFKDIYVIGLCLSKDHRYLFFNSRKRMEHDVNDSWNLTLSEEIEIKAVDLQTLEIIPMAKLWGHKAFSSFPAWYICIDVCEDYVVSGSEDAKGYVWDRRYGQLLSTLDHSTGVVNGVCFNPCNSECLVTVGDDRTIKIWLSRNLHNKYTYKTQL